MFRSGAHATVALVGLAAGVSLLAALGGCCCYRQSASCPTLDSAEALPRPTPRTDGVYQSVERDGNDPLAWHYIRFYADGTVLTVTHTSTPPDLQWLFRREDPDESRGHVELSGERLSFTSVSSAGRVDYEGTIAGDTLRLASHSHINGHRGDRTFRFVAWQIAKPVAKPANRAK